MIISKLVTVRITGDYLSLTLARSLLMGLTPMLSVGVQFTVQTPEANLLWRPTWGWYEDNVTSLLLVSWLTYPRSDLHRRTGLETELSLWNKNTISNKVKHKVINLWGQHLNRQITTPNYDQKCQLKGCKLHTCGKHFFQKESSVYKCAKLNLLWTVNIHSYSGCTE